MKTNLTEEQQSLLKLYRSGYESILNVLKASVDNVMDLAIEPLMYKLSVEIVIESGCVPTYTIKTEKFPTFFTE